MRSFGNVEGECTFPRFIGNEGSGKWRFGFGGTAIGSERSMVYLLSRPWSLCGASPDREAGQKKHTFPRTITPFPSRPSQRRQSTPIGRSLSCVTTLGFNSRLIFPLRTCRGSKRGSIILLPRLFIPICLHLTLGHRSD
jgi:hypothetical protein